MPRIYAQASVSWTQSPTTVVDAEVNVLNSTSGSEVGGNDVDFTSAVADALLPGSAATPIPQVSNPEVRVDGVAIPFDRFVGRWSYVRDIDQNAQVFEFSLWSRVGDRYFTRNVHRCLSPDTGKDDIEVDGVYVLPGGTVVKYPLIRSGRVDSQTRDEDGDLTIDTYRVLDGAGTVGRDGVTATYPVGGGLRREQLADELLSVAGYAGATAFPQMAETTRQVVLVKGDPLNAIRDVFEPELRGIVMAPDGVFDAPRYRPDGAGELVLTPDDILELSPSTYTSDSITLLSATGAREEIDEDSIGTRYIGKKIRSFRLSNGGLLRYSQASGTGVLSALAAWPGPTETVRPAEVTRISETRQCGSLIFRVSFKQGIYNPVQARYQYSGAAWTPLSCYVPDGATQDGEVEQGHRYPHDRYLSLELIEERWIYDAAGFPDLSIPIPVEGGARIPEPQVFRPQQTGADTGFFRGRVRTIWRLVALERAIKTRSAASTTWESEDYITSLYVRGPRVGMASQSAEFQIVEQEHEVFNAEADGTLRERLLLRLAPIRRPGWQYLYADGVESRDSEEALRFAYSITEHYVSGGAARHEVHSTAVDYSERESIEILNSTEAGPVPLVDRVRRREAEEVLIAGSTTCIPTAQAVPIETEVTAPNLEDCQERRSETVNFDRAETVDELEAMGEAAIRESAEPATAVTIPTNFAAREGQVASIDWPPRGWVGESLLIRRVETSGEWGGVSETTLSGPIRSAES